MTDAIIAIRRPLISAPNLTIGTTIVRAGLDYDVAIEYCVYDRLDGDYHFMIIDIDFDGYSPEEEGDEPMSSAERATLTKWFNANWEKAAVVADGIYQPY